MTRLKYNQDGQVLINNNYKAVFAKFSEHCVSLGIPNPLTEGDYVEYAPGKGTEIITSEGHHIPSDDEVLTSALSAIIGRASEFVVQANPTPSPMSKEEKVYVEKFQTWPLERQVEALIENQGGRPGKLNQLKADFSAIEAKY